MINKLKQLMTLKIRPAVSFSLLSLAIVLFIASVLAANGAGVTVRGTDLYVTGNVGIGTASPGAQLDARSDTVQNINWGGLTAKKGVISWGATGAKVRSAAGVALQLGSNDVDDRLTIATDGNVGIGTTNPGGRLEVNNANEAGAGLRIFGTDNEAATDAINVTDENNNLDFRIRTVAGDNGATGAQAYFRGNVGIGTADPKAQLEVGGTSYPGNPGRIRVTSPGAGPGLGIDIYMAEGSGTDSGHAACRRYSTNAICLAHWSSGESPSTCDTAQGNGIALCADFPPK